MKRFFSTALVLALMCSILPNAAASTSITIFEEVRETHPGTHTISAEFKTSAGDNGNLGIPLPEDHNVPSTVQWSYPTITGRTVTQNTYRGKIQVLIFFRTNGDCLNSDQTIRSLATTNWINFENVKVIAVGCGENGESAETVKEHVISYKQQYAPNCEDIEFCYITSAQMWSTIRQLQSLIEASSSGITYAVNYVFDSENHLRFTWQGSYSSDYYSSVLSFLDDGIEPGSGICQVKIGGFNDYDSTYTMLESLNSYRRENGLSELIMDKDLLETAMQRASEIAVYYSHTRPDGRDCFTAFPEQSSNGVTTRENIAVGFGSADGVMTAWKNSPGHNANMLATSNHSVGIGAFVDSHGIRYWVQVFSSLQGTAETVQTVGAKTVIADITAVSGVLNVSVSPTSAILHAGEIAKFTASNTNAGWNYSTPEIHFTYAKSSDENVAAVSIGEDGKAVVVPTGAGTTTVKLGFASLGNGTPLTTDVAISIIGTELSRSMFTVDTSAETYNGTPKTKTISSTLTADKDYTVTYCNNTDVGTATITITGKGMYSGTLTYNFTIHYNSTVPATDHIYDVVDPGEKVVLPVERLETVTNPTTASSAVTALTSTMTAEQKASATGVDLATLYAEAAVSKAASKAVSGKEIIINKAAVSDLEAIAAETSSAVETALVNGGVTAARLVSNTVALTTDETGEITIKIDPDILTTQVDKIRVETPTYALTIKVDDLKDDLTQIVTITAQDVGSGFAPGDKNKKTTVKVNLPKGKITNPVTLSLPTDESDVTYQAVVKTDGSATSSKYNPATITMDGKINTSGSYTVQTNEKDFTDIANKSAEMQKAIRYLASKGIINGTSDTTFSPDGSISRAEIAALLVRALGKLDNSATNSFTDVKTSDWFYSAAGSSQRCKLINGYPDGTFQGTATITKDQILAVSARVLKTEMGYKEPSSASSYLSKYSDEVAQWAQPEVALATKENLVVYRVDGTFKGAGSMTRGDAAIIIYRLFQKIW